MISVKSYALESDQTQKLYISSDSADLDSQTGKSVYNGHVTIDQGTTHVYGDIVTSFSDAHYQMKKVIVKSLSKKPATFSTKTDLTKPTLVATAKTIQYYPSKHYAILLGDARVVQGDNTITGEHLEYDINRKILRSLSEKIANTRQHSRTTIIIEPNNAPKTSAKKTAVKNHGTTHS